MLLPEFEPSTRTGAIIMTPASLADVTLRPWLHVGTIFRVSGRCRLALIVELSVHDESIHKTLTRVLEGSRQPPNHVKAVSVTLPQLLSRTLEHLDLRETLEEILVRRLSLSHGCFVDRPCLTCMIFSVSLRLSKRLSAVTVLSKRLSGHSAECASRIRLFRTFGRVSLSLTAGLRRHSPERSESSHFLLRQC